MDYGTGRIADIIDSLEKTNGQLISDILASKKLDALCDAMQIAPSSLDNLMANNSPVLRTVKGHVFESFFDTLFRKNGYKVTEVGGDDSVDRIVNKHSLQLKTYTESGTKGEFVQFKTHKTHGAKSEKESLDYYHRVDHFADFLVGLISYNPLRIIFISRDELPKHPKSSDHILSPFTIRWKDHPGLNNFDRIGFQIKEADSGVISSQNEILPLTSSKVGVSSDVILNTILSKSNF